MALKGKRVLVIDGDMRHGSTSAYIGSPQEGIANYLANPGTQLHDIIVQDAENPLLDILPVGVVPPIRPSCLSRRASGNSSQLCARLTIIYLSTARPSR